MTRGPTYSTILPIVVSYQHTQFATDDGLNRDDLFIVIFKILYSKICNGHFALNTFLRIYKELLGFTLRLVLFVVYSLLIGWCIFFCATGFC